MSIHDSAPNNDDPSGQGDRKGTRYSPELWKTIKDEWRADPSMSYATAVKIVGERLGIPVPSKGACATYAKRNGWMKDGAEGAEVDGHAPERPGAESPAPKRAVAKHLASRVANEPAADDASEVVDDTANGLNPRQRRFADLYLILLNATEAYKQAGYTTDDPSAKANAARLLANANVAAYVAARQAAVQEKLEITHEMVLKRWWTIVTADPNELVEYRRDNCRHCWGTAYGYQWIDEEEFLVAVVRYQRDEDKAKPAGEKFHREPPDGAGGFGYIKSKQPNPDCPQRHGDVTAMSTFTIRAAPPPSHASSTPV